MKMYLYNTKFFLILFFIKDSLCTVLYNVVSVMYPTNAAITIFWNLNVYRIKILKSFGLCMSFNSIFAYLIFNHNTVTTTLVKQVSSFEEFTLSSYGFLLKIPHCFNFISSEKVF